MSHDIPADTLELSGDGLRLRPWRESDVASLAEAARDSAASVGRWLPWCHAAYGIEEATAWIGHCRSGWHAGEHFAFAVEDVVAGELLGGASLNQCNRLHRSANLGYWIRTSRQHRGIAAKAARMVAEFGFAQLGLIRIEVVVMPGNQASLRTARKIGARFEAIARQRLWSNGEAHDAAVYGLVPQDLSGTGITSTG